jgi:methyltransferase (TIGR00027 family)
MLPPVRRATRSRTAQYVAQVRAVLDHKGVIDDPYAFAMLTIGMKAVVGAMERPPLRRRTNSPFFAGLAARTLFFEREVASALDAGIQQVVVIGAGYDSRAWRFARPNVRFFEVDHPATQEDKKRRAPGDGPTYVPLDLESGSLSESLRGAGFDSTRPVLFVVEGVTMYLDRSDVHSLLAVLGDNAAPRSRLAVNFAAPPGTGAAAERRRQRVLRLLGRLGGEPHRSSLRASEAGGFVASAGWRVDRATTLREIARELLASTELRIEGINAEASAVAASQP